jgi:hypothetical protein
MIEAWRFIAAHPSPAGGKIASHVFTASAAAADMGGFRAGGRF